MAEISTSAMTKPVVTIAKTKTVETTTPQTKAEEPKTMPTETTTAVPKTKPQEPEIVPKNSELMVRFIDVGQGSATLISCDGKYMLIDGGDKPYSSTMYSILKSQGITELAYMVNTHAHADHVGGLPGALNYAKVDHAMSSVTSYDSEAFRDYLKYLDKQGVPLTVPKVGDKFSLGSASFTVLSSTHNTDNPNNDSIDLKMVYGKYTFLLTGDAEREVEEEILNSGFDISSTVLQVGHHGGDTSTTYPFLREIMPKYAVISVGKGNTYGHPTDAVLSKLRDADVKVLRTDMQGDIIFTSDGTNLSYTVEKNRDADTLIAGSIITQQTTKPSITTKPTTTTKTDSQESDYVLNTNTKKIHKPGCSSVKQMS
ncbi:MAG: ComEC/Rec2 family competence protein, partial [Mobilitalea sp.]